MRKYPCSIANYPSRSSARVTVVWPWLATCRSGPPRHPVESFGRARRCRWPKLGGIHLTSPGADAVHAPIALATSDMAAALSDVRVVLVAVPACAHADVARDVRGPSARWANRAARARPHRRRAGVSARASRGRLSRRILLGEANTFPSPLAASGRRRPSSTGQGRSAGRRPARQTHAGTAGRMPALPADASPRTLGAAHRTWPTSARSCTRSSPC